MGFGAVYLPLSERLTVFGLIKFCLGLPIVRFFFLWPKCGCFSSAWGWCFEAFRLLAWSFWGYVYGIISE